MDRVHALPARGLRAVHGGFRVHLLHLELRRLEHTANGIGTWQATTQLPTSESAPYAAAGSSIYYLSIPAYFASVSADGIGTWQTTTNYPGSLYPPSCVSTGDFVYCVAAQGGSSYFAQVGAVDPNGIQLEDPPPFPVIEYLVQDALNGPTWGTNIDDAIVFACDRSQAATPAGCSTTLPNARTGQTSDLTIQFPCAATTAGSTNCCFGDTPAWCSWVGPNALVITAPKTPAPAQSP